MPALKSFRLRHALLMSCAFITVEAIAPAAMPAYAQAAVREFAIPAQALADALRAFANTTGRDVLFAPAIVAGKRSPGVKGPLSESAALHALLAGTGLTFEVTSANGYAVLAAQTQGSAARSPEGQAQPDAPAGASGTAADDTEVQEKKPVEKVTVTGSRIRGAKSTSPVVTVTQDDMRRAGHNNLGEAMRALPQNFAGGQNPGIAFGAGPNPNANYTGSSSINLRGLGADATLTLLNGARLPYDGLIQATDVSVVPIAAIERVEVLLDGASAIYGSDAVAGVANIILKRDYDGAEFSARYGAATDGGFEQHQYTAVAGTNWVSGGFLIAGDSSSSTAVRARQRDYLSTLPNQNITIHPSSSQKGLLFSGHQGLDDVAELTVDAFYTMRDATDYGQTSVIFDAERDSIIWGVIPALRFNLPGDWSLRLHGAFGENDNKYKAHAYLPATGTPLALVSPITQWLNEAESAGVDVEGPLFDLPGGEARLSVGGGYRRTTFDQVELVAGRTAITGEARSDYVYGEINLPFISEDQDIALVNRLIVDAAFRHESHDSFGEVTTPKVGLIWGLFPGLDLRASWGESFKAPTLNQQFQDQKLYLYPASLFSSGLPAGTTVFFGTGGNPTLEPERADVTTAGFVADPTFLPGLHVEFGWFDIDYTNRIIQPSTTQLFNPAYASFFTISPTSAQQDAFFATLGFPVGTFTLNASGGPYVPANVSAIIDTRFKNSLADHVSGVDLISHYTTEAFDGSLTLGGNASWIEATRQLTSTAPTGAASGIIFFPAEFKGRIGASWTGDGLTLSGNVNHVSGVRNTNLVSLPMGASMTTVDLVVDYQLETEQLGGFGFTFAVTNLFDQHPPYIQSSQVFFVPYDSTNYSPLGRIVSATVTKRF